MSEVSPRTVVASLAVVAVVGAAFLVGEQDEPSGGPDDAAPPDRSGQARIVTPEEFCTAFDALATAHEGLLSAASPIATSDLKERASTLSELAPGTAMSDDARAGVEYVVTVFLSLDDDATAQEVVESDDAATRAETARTEALGVYLQENCGESGLSSAR